jgi:DNA (cytosine-5)-methyltransferase 1
MPAGSVTYCGSSFGLLVRRHRLFASNVTLTAPVCDHGWQDAQGRIYPSVNNVQRKRYDGRGSCVVGVYGGLQSKYDTIELRRRAMGIDWLDNSQLTQAIPPACTEHIGRQLMEEMQ